MTIIGTLHETDLHAALKRHYARPIDRLEANVAGYVVDVLRADDPGDIIEIQTENLAALKRKLPRLLENTPSRWSIPSRRRSGWCACRPIGAQ